MKFLHQAHMLVYEDFWLLQFLCYARVLVLDEFAFETFMLWGEVLSVLISDDIYNHWNFCLFIPSMITDESHSFRKVQVDVRGCSIFNKHNYSRRLKRRLIGFESICSVTVGVHSLSDVLVLCSSSYVWRL